MNEMVVKAREVLHNLKTFDFDACGNYKVDRNEGNKIIELLEDYVAMKETEHE